MMNLTEFKPQLVGEGSPETFLYNNRAILVEPKIDGIRVLLQKNGEDIRLFTRKGKDVTEKYQAILKGLSEEIVAKSIVLDGEMAVMQGKLFTMSNIVLKRELEPGERYVYFPFDILELEGQCLMQDPLLARKQTMQMVLNPNTLLAPIPYYPVDNMQDINSILKKVRENGMEGVVLKSTGVYTPNSRYNWLKIKPFQGLDMEVLDRKERKDGGWIYRVLGEGVEASVSTTLDIPNGTIVEVKHNGRFGSKLRFPQIMRIRDDL